MARRISLVTNGTVSDGSAGGLLQRRDLDARLGGDCDLTVGLFRKCVDDVSGAIQVTERQLL